MRKLIERCVIDDCPITINEHYTKRGVFRVQLERQGHRVRMVPAGPGNAKRVRQVFSRHTPKQPRDTAWNNWWQERYAAA